VPTIVILHIYSLKTSSFSKSLSNCRNFFYRFPSISKKIIKLDGVLHFTLGLFGQFLLTKISFLKFSVCNLHLLKVVNIPFKEKILSVLICDPRMHMTY
jgi:esterase/lipase superfamily enzyme